MRGKSRSETLPNRCVLVADGARGRFFTIVEDRGDKEGSRLLERSDFINPEGKLTDEEVFSDVASGRKNRSSVTGGGYSLDDENAGARDESLRRFARLLATEARAFVESHRAGELFIVATPRFLGVLRPEVVKSLPLGSKCSALPCEVSARKAWDIESILIRRGFLRAAPRPQNIYRPRAQMESHAVRGRERGMR